jgi:hypothetical protein
LRAQQNSAHPSEHSCILSAVRLTLTFMLLCACSELTLHAKPVHVLPSKDTAAAQDTAPPSLDTGTPSSDTARPSDSGHPETPEEPPPDGGFSLGWHILDEGRIINTTTNPEYFVDHHGDHDLYWYEPSGLHGLMDSTDPSADFEALRQTILDRVPEPSEGIGLLHYYRDSEVHTFDRATFTYVLCDFWLTDDEPTGAYVLSTGPVDDGIKVLVNGATLGHMRLDDPGQSWSLGSVLRPGRNTLIVILVDDSEMNKFIQDMAFYRDGEMVTATELP